MQIFRRIATVLQKAVGLSPVHARSWWWPIIREPFAGAWQKNVVDSRESLLAFAAVFACITRIANDIGKLPPRLMEQDENGIWMPVLRQSPYWAVLVKPNRYQNRIQFFVYWLLSKLTHGNVYVLKQRDQRGIVTALYVLDPTRVTVLVASDGSVWYQLQGDDLSQVPNGLPAVPASEIIHDLINPLFHPLVGVSPIFACGSAATQGNRIQSNSSKFFENMSQPSGVLTAPTFIPDEQLIRMKAEWQTRFSGENAGRVAILGGGLKYEAMAIPAAEAQLIEQLKWTAEDVARAFGVPLYKINAGPVPTSNNVEALNQQYYTDCLQFHIEAIELCLDEGLGLTDVPEHTYGVEFDLDVLLRMDSATALESLAKGVGAGIVSPDEARLRRNLPPVPGGASPYLQQQNYSLAALAKRDAQDDPFGKTAAPALAVPDDEPDDDAAEEARALLEHIMKGLECEPI